ncbi:GspE/PulE family protein [Planctomycetota bacterium]
MLSEKKLTTLLRTEGLVTDEQLIKAYEHQELHKIGLKESLVGMGVVCEEDIIGAMVSTFDLSYVRLKNRSIDKSSLRYVTRERCQHHTLIPIAVAENLLTVAMADPTDVVAIDDIKMQTGMEIFPVIAKESEIKDALVRYYTSEEESIGVITQKIDRQYSIEDVKKLGMLKEADKDSALIVQLVNSIVENAYYQSASDIHIEPFEKVGLVRYRIDGVLHESLRLPIKSLTPLVARLKIMAELNISERRLPLDGRIIFKHFSKSGLDIDLRVSTVPVVYGEKVVMRILDSSGSNVDVNKLGYTKANMDKYMGQIIKPYGMVLHVGPTGSGKTTALYSALAHITSPEKNIQTAEDPIEYNLAGVNQCQIRADIGFNFARALRSFLRQDPDVIMIGEIRDVETAEIAIEAALTGHMVFSTLHTNDAAGTVARFIEMGVEPVLVASAVVCVVAQRLVRRLCRCMQQKIASSNELARMGLDGKQVTICRPLGCKLCNNNGYRGRMGVHEVLVMDDEIRSLVMARAAVYEIHKQGVANGMTTLFEDGIAKILDRSTSLEEVLRVLR